MPPTRRLLLLLPLAVLLSAGAAVSPAPAPAEVRAAIEKGPVEEPFEPTWSHLEPLADGPSEVVVAGSGARVWVARVEPGIGQSPRIVQLGPHFALVDGSKRPNVLFVDDDGQARGYKVLTVGHRITQEIEANTGALLGSWTRVRDDGHEIPPLLVDLPDGGWVFYGEREGRSPRPDRRLTPPMDRVAGVATVGPTGWSPGGVVRGPASLGEERRTLISARDGAGCIDLSVVPGRFWSFSLGGLPGVRESLRSDRHLRIEPGEPTVRLEATDARELPLHGGTRIHGPTAGTMMLGGAAAPVSWEADLDADLVTRLFDALERGLRCEGATEDGFPFREARARVALLGAQGRGLTLMQYPDDDAWILEHWASRGRFRMADTGLRAALDALWAQTQAGGEERWALAEARCPPPLDGAAVAGMAFDYEWSGLHGRIEETWEWTLMGGAWSWIRHSDRDGATSGSVDGALIAALLDAASQEVSCQTVGYSVSTHTDDYPKWKLRLTLKDGRELVLSSESNTPTWLPWLVTVDGYSGVQEGGEVGVALQALLDAVRR